MKLQRTMAAKGPAFERSFKRVIEGLALGMTAGDVLIITTDPETGRWAHSVTRKSPGEKLSSTLQRAIQLD